MNFWIRATPVLGLVLLLVIRVFHPDFLAVPVLPSVRWLAWLSWFMLVFAVIGYLAAWVLAPGFARVIGWLAKRSLLPLALLFGFAVGVVFFLELAVNFVADLVCKGFGVDSCWQMNIFAPTLSAISGK